MDKTAGRNKATGMLRNLVLATAFTLGASQLLATPALHPREVHSVSTAATSVTVRALAGLASPAKMKAAADGYWTGYWTWTGTGWYWTWVWVWTNGSYSAS